MLLIIYSVNVTCRVFIVVGAIVKANLSFLHHQLASWCCFLIDAGQEVLGNSQSVLQERVVWVAAWSVLEQVLGTTEKKCR